MDYLPYKDRIPTRQYQNLLNRILTHGTPAPTRQGVTALTLMQQAVHYDLRQGFPVITERDVTSFWDRPIAELCAFINGATTITELVAFGCTWWKPWATAEKCAKRGLPEGDLGPASYGGAFRHFPDGTTDGFDQFGNLVRQLQELPHERVHLISPWIPQWQARGTDQHPRSTIAPCHGWIHLRVLDDRLHLHMFQRSGDVPVGVPSNMIQYGALLLMLEQLTGIPAGCYYHTISDAHIYEDQIDAVKKMIPRSPRRLPTVHLTDAGREVTAIHDFRAEHFVLSDYHPHPALTRIPVAV